jgi:hypothetical protein
MKIYKVEWSNIDYGNSLEYGGTGGIAVISSNYINPRITKSELYSNRLSAEARMEALKAAANTLGDSNISVYIEELEVIE